MCWARGRIEGPVPWLRGVPCAMVPWVPGGDFKFEFLTRIEEADRVGRNVRLAEIDAVLPLGREDFGLWPGHSVEGARGCYG
ncbi:hypothetical protein ACQJBY_013072 [Aegilops geniculata]